MPFFWSVLAFLLAYSTVHQCLAEETLDGYAFDCGGLLIGFGVNDQIHRMNGSGIPCGDYRYDGEAILSGYSSLTGPFNAWSLDVVDGILVSFQSDLGVACNVVSLNWRQYSTSRFVGLKCPIQNEIPDVSFQDNHFSLGVSGDVALRSPLELTASGRRLVRDSYGVYQWSQDDNTIRLYFGPQQGQRRTIVDGKLTPEGKLYVDGYHPPGPCMHDGTSTLQDVSALPRTSHRVETTPSPLSTTGDSKESSAAGSTKTTTLLVFGVLVLACGALL